jgi:hypothetical protein
MKKAVLAAAILTTFNVGAIPVAKADRAVVVRSDGNCTLFDGNGMEVSGTAFKATFTQSNSGNATAQCVGDVTPSSTARAVHYNFQTTGELCVIFDPTTMATRTTQNWEETVSATGNARITCHF